MIERGAAITLTRIGQCQTHVANQLNCSRQAVARWEKRYADTGDIKEEEGRGKKRKTNEIDDTNRVFSSSIDPFATPRVILSQLDLDVSTRTIDRRLHEAGLFGRVAARKRKFTEQVKKKRLSFAEGYRDWTEKDWERVLFSDEAIITGEGG